MSGPNIQVCLMTADDEKNLLNSENIDLETGPIDSVCKLYPIYNALMVEKLPAGNNCFPYSENLKHFYNASDLVRSGKFPDFVDNNLHLLICIIETYFTSFSKVRKPFKPDQHYMAKCLLGWVPYGRDSKLKTESLGRCNYIRTTEEKLEKRLDTIIYESFAEKAHDDNVASSVEEKLVLNFYKKSVKNVEGRLK